MRRCVAVLDLMAMHTLYGVMAFTEADLRETCRLAFDFSLLLPADWSNRRQQSQLAELLLTVEVR